MNVAVIVAGGTGDRLGAPGGKQLLEVAGLPVLGHTLRAFERCGAVDRIIVVVHPERLAEYRARAIDPVASAKTVAVVGGATRQGSVARGIAAADPLADVIVVHDGARPLVTPETIAASIHALLGDETLGGVVVGHPSYDTLKTVDPDGWVRGTPDRGALWVAQTPQAFRASVLREAYADAEAHGVSGTDDSSLVERAGWPVRMLLGPRDNIKVTVPEDLAVVERLLEMRGDGRG